MSKKSCEGCIYYRCYSRSNVGDKGCHYMYDTWEKRGCPVDNCTRKTLKKDGKPDKRR